MGKRARTLFIVAVVAVLAALAWVVLQVPARPTEPVYDGKPLSYWLLQLAPGHGGFGPNSNRLAARSALDQIGTNAIPTLLQLLRAHDFPLKAKFLTWASEHPFLRVNYTKPDVLNLRAVEGFGLLGKDRAVIAVPDLIKILDQRLSPDSILNTAVVLADIGPEAKAAVPALLRTATSKNQDVRGSAIEALGRIHSNSDAVIPALTRELGDPNPTNRWLAVIAIEQFQGDARSASQALVEWLADPHEQTLQPQLYNNIRLRIERSLLRIDPETYARVVTNPVPATK